VAGGGVGPARNRAKACPRPERGTLDSGCCRSGKRGRAVDSSAALSRRYRYLSRYRYLILWTPGRGPSLRLRVPAVQLIPAALPIAVLARGGGGVESNEKVARRLVCHPWCLDSGVQAGKIRRERIFARDKGFGAGAFQTIAPRRRFAPCNWMRRHPAPIFRA